MMTEERIRQRATDFEEKAQRAARRACTLSKPDGKPDKVEAKSAADFWLRAAELRWVLNDPGPEQPKAV